ncbi:MAG: ATP-binding protein [Actinobacteria bacterium]|nr:ATP-binding protein [Actinomycetota bacterium]
MGRERDTAFELEMPAKAKYVSLARLLAGSIARRMNFSEDCIDDLKIAVSEMCTNAIVHTGNGTAEKPAILVRFLAGEDRLTIEVRDRGPGFDPDLVLGCEGGDLLDKGFGIPLIRSLVDVFECDSHPQGGTVVSVTKYLHPEKKDT